MRVLGFMENSGANKARKEQEHMTNASSFSPGDVAVAKFARYPARVTVEERLEDGSWRVRTHSGATRIVRRLESPDGLRAESADDAAPQEASATPPAEEVSAPAEAAPVVDEAKAKMAVPSPKAVPPKGIGLLSAAAAVLERSDAPMSVKTMIEAAKAQGLWTPKGGKTPEQTLYSAIIREIKDKGGQSRFRKEGRGLFAFAQ